MNEIAMKKADTISGLVLFLLGIYMVIEGLFMPGAGGFIEKGGEPGKVPVMLGIIITLLALVLLLRSLFRQNQLQDEASGNNTEIKIGVRRCLFAAVICSFYAVGLLGAKISDWKMPYELATFLFLVAFVICFEWSQMKTGELTPGAWWTGRIGLIANSGRRHFIGWLVSVFMQALIVTVLVSYLFESQFYVKLP